MKGLLFAVIFASLIGSPSVRADWINLSGAMSANNVAEFHVNDDHVRVVLEVYVRDLDAFVDLIPADMVKPGVAHSPLTERQRRFAMETLQIVADGQLVLPVRFERVEPRVRIDRPNPYAGMLNPTTMRPVPGPPDDKRVLYAELTYPFPAGARPRTLTFVPPTGKRGYSRVGFGFIAYHRGVPVIDYSYLSEPANLALDWLDPWYSRFDKRQYKRWQQSGMLTFLYVEPFEVRHEILVRVQELAAWMDLGLRGADFIKADEFEPLKKRIGEFLLAHSNVTIDGRSLSPILDRTNFVKRTMTRTFFIDQPERLALNTAMVGVVVTYLTKQVPQEVTVDWELFSDRIQKVPTIAEDPAGPFPGFVTPDDPVLVWKNYLKTYQPPTVVQIDVDRQISEMKLPVASIVCMFFCLPFGMQIRSRKKHQKRTRYQIGTIFALIVMGVLLYPFGSVSVGRPAVLAPQIGEEQAAAIVESLLKNVYRSFDFREESDIYDRLATSVHGDLLQTIYLQSRKSLIVTQAGGAQAKVKEVDIQKVSLSPRNARSVGLVCHTQWTALGVVGHWGHSHSRKNQYEAKLIIEPVEGIWKIIGLELLEEKRIDSYQVLK